MTLSTVCAPSQTITYERHRWTGGGRREEGGGERGSISVHLKHASTCTHAHTLPHLGVLPLELLPGHEDVEEAKVE